MNEVAVDFIARSLKGRRSLEQALADLRSRHMHDPTGKIAEMIRQLEAEIAERRRSPP